MHCDLGSLRSFGIGAIVSNLHRIGMGRLHSRHFGLGSEDLRNFGLLDSSSPLNDVNGFTYEIGVTLCQALETSRKLCRG